MGIPVKESSNLDNIPDFPKGRIQIVLLPGTGLNLNELISKVDTFYNLIDVHPTVMSYEFPGIPNKLGVANLKAKDAVCVVGNKGSTIVDFVLDRYSSMMTGGFPSDNFHSVDDLLEQGNAGNVDVNGKIQKNIVSVVKAGTMTHERLTIFRCQGNRRALTAFLIFHATGHNAGIIHGSHTELPTGIGYMSSGNCILNLLRMSNINPYNCGLIDNYKMKKSYGYTSLDAIIIENKQDNDPRMINQLLRIKNRYE